jgi:hypothetical protein
MRYLDVGLIIPDCAISNGGVRYLALRYLAWDGSSQGVEYLRGPVRYPTPWISHRGGISKLAGISKPKVRYLSGRDIPPSD